MQLAWVKKTLPVLVAVAHLWALLLPMSSVLAQAETRVVVAPASVSVGAQQTAAVELRIENVQALYGFDIRIGFDPAVVEVVDADPGTEGTQILPGDMLSLDFVIRNEADNVQGTVWFALTQLNPSEAVSGSGTAYTIVFKGKQQGARCALSITYQKLATRDGETLAATTQDGEIQVVAVEQAPAAPTAAPLPAQPTVVAPIARAVETTAAPRTAMPTEAATAAGPAASAMPTETAAPTVTSQPTQAPPTAQPLTAAPSKTDAAPPSPTPPPATRPTPTTRPSSPAGGVLSSPLLLGALFGALVLGAFLWLSQRSK